MSVKKYKLESRLSLYKIANKNCATMAKIKHNMVTMLYRNIYRKRAQSFHSRYRPVLRLRSDCCVYAERSPTYKTILMANHHKLLTSLSSP